MDDKAVTQTLKNDLSWLQKHERLIITALLLAAVLFLGNKFLNISADHAKLTAAFSQQQLTEAKQTLAQVTQQAEAAATQHQAVVNALTHQNAALVSGIATRDMALQQRQQAVQTMALPDLAIRWKGLAGLTDGLDATAVGITASDDAARKTVTQLEKVPVLESDLKDTKAVASNRQTELDSANGLIGSLNTQIAACNATVAASTKACKDEVADVKAHARTSKRNWFVGGLVTAGTVYLYLHAHGVL